jgi:hypothetical protein
MVAVGPLGPPDASLNPNLDPTFSRPPFLSAFFLLCRDFLDRRILGAEFFFFYDFFDIERVFRIGFACFSGLTAFSALFGFDCIFTVLFYFYTLLRAAVRGWPIATLYQGRGYLQS